MLSAQRFSLRVACAIPTCNAKNDLSRLLDSLEQQTAEHDVLLVDSSSVDGTSELALGRVKRVKVISREDFNHGATRQMMVDDNPNYDIYVFLTQDAFLESTNALAEILRPFSDPMVAVVCGRQLPHYDANPLEQHARYFNYPPTTQVKTLDDVPELGIKAAFISNSFAAYRGCALKAVGGFPADAIASEDLFVAAKMLLAGYKVVNSGEATCRHSHNYTITEEFKRYFDIGVFHARESWIHQKFGGVGTEGIRYFISELKFLGIRRINLWPFSILRNALKFLAYKLGKNEAKLPLGLKKKIGMHRGYWDSSGARKR